jgi:phage terminase small subunit
MPRKSKNGSIGVAGLRVDGRPAKLTPPKSLGAAERALFVELVEANTPEHFRPSDQPLLCRFVEAACLAEKAAHELSKHGAVIDGKASPYLIVQEKSVRAMTALSMRLRLSPQSRFDGRAAARAQEYTGPRPWELTREEREEEEATNNGAGE